MLNIDAKLMFKNIQNPGIYHGRGTPKIFSKSDIHYGTCAHRHCKIGTRWHQWEHILRTQYRKLNTICTVYAKMTVVICGDTKQTSKAGHSETTGVIFCAHIGCIALHNVRKNYK